MLISITHRVRGVFGSSTRTERTLFIGCCHELGLGLIFLLGNARLVSLKWRMLRYCLFQAFYMHHTHWWDKL